MKFLFAYLVLLLLAVACFSEMTDLEDGVVNGIIRNKDTNKCISIEKSLISTIDKGQKEVCRMQMREGYCPKSFQIARDGLVVDSATGDVLHHSDEDIFLFSQDWKTRLTPLRVSVQGDGRILFDDGKQCITFHEGLSARITFWLLPKQSSDEMCQDRSSLFRLVSSGTSWFSSDSSQKADRIDSSKNHCQKFERRVCSLAEVCPSSPGGQSAAGVTGESSTKALLVEGQTFVDAATCKTVNDKSSSYDVDGFLCCPTENFARVKNLVNPGYGFLMHKSGLCVDYNSGVLSLSNECNSQTALMIWSRDGALKQGTECIVPESYGQCPPFQFTNDNSLQNVFTGKCLVPNEGGMSPAPGTVLVEQAACGEEYSSFTLKKAKGYLKHFSSKCVGVNADKLVIKDTCSTLEEVFQKEQFKSVLIHSASGKCVAKPSQDSEALTLTDCASRAEVAKLTFDGKTLGFGENKCVQPRGGGGSPANNDELVIGTGCSSEASRFYFADAVLCEGDESCKCVEGYEKNSNGHCFPINNCKLHNGGCLDGAKCVNTGPGTSMCTCPPGYQLKSDGITCEQCPDKNCYSQCQFMDYNELKTLMNLQDHFEVRFMTIKTSDLSPYLTGSRTKELIIYSHQITISGELKVPNTMEKFAIFANEFLLEDGAQIVLENTATAGRSAVVKVKNDKLLCENQYSAEWVGIVQGPVFDIYTSKASAPFSCSGNYNSRDMSIQAAIKSKGNPKRSLDAELYSIILNCAKVKAQGTPFSKDGKLLKGSLPVSLIDYVLDDIRAAKKGELDTSSANVQRLVAKNLMEDLSIRASGNHRVPYLSLKAHEKILILIKDDAKLAIQKYERFERITQDFSTRIEATDSMTELLSTIVKKNDLEVASLKTQLELAKADLKAMQVKLEEAKTALETAKEVFAAGVRQYQNKMIANAIFSVIGGVSSVFAAGAGGVVGFTIELGDLAADIGKLQKTMFKLGIVMDSITNIADAANTFTDLHYDVIPYAGAGVSDYYSKSMPEFKDKSLSVMLKEWDVFEAEANAFLTVGTASEISGASDYLAALSTVAIWGRGYHEKSITVQDILSTLTMLKSLQKEQHTAQKKIKTSRDNALVDVKVNGVLLTEMALQKQRLRNIMIDKLMLFCDSYFYNWLSECPVIPTMSDDLYALHEKVNQGLSAVINAVENFAPFIPQEFEATIILKDNSEKCSGGTKKRSADGALQLALNTLECPVSELKRAKEFLFKIDEEEPLIFKGHERVHVEEIEIYFEGASFGRATRGDKEIKDGDLAETGAKKQRRARPKKKRSLKQVITAWISFTGMMTDVFRGKRYQFLAPPRIIEFSYRINPDKTYEVTQFGKVSSKFQEYYDGIAALTTWSVSVPKSVNRRGLNLDGVNYIKIKVKGTRVPVQRVKRSRRSGLDESLGVAKDHEARVQRRNGTTEKISGKGFN